MPMTQYLSKTIQPILSQHAEEAAFQWLMRDAAVLEPHYSLKDLAKLDNRVEAHLDGLRIAGEKGWNICKEALTLEEPGEVFTATLIALEGKEVDRIEAVLDAGADDPELSRGIVSALGWFPYAHVENKIRGFLSSESTSVRKIGIAASSIHRIDPGIALKEALQNSNEFLRARALKASGELGKKELLPLIRDQLGEEQAAIRFYAAWSAALLGDMAGLPVLRGIAEKAGRFSERACITAMMKMRISDSISWFKILKANKENRRVTIIGAGATGTSDTIPWLIEEMAKPPQARVAGEAFSMITGVNIAYLDLEGEWPEGFEAGPTENPEDEEIQMDSDEDLPWPNQNLIQKWWDENKKNFQRGTRYLLGKPIKPPQLQQVLMEGKQRERSFAALQLTMNRPETPLFEVRTPGFVQLTQLKKSSLSRT